MSKKIIIVYGPTAIGKTSFSLTLAKKFKGELISADSRQIYRGMDIGTGKDLKAVGKVQIHLLDEASPDQIFSSYRWAKLAKSVICKIEKKNKLPLVVGGSAFYIKTLIDGLDVWERSVDWSMRKKLEQKKLSDLQRKLRSVWPKKWRQMNNSDKKNTRRLIRAIEMGLVKEKIKKKSFLGKDFSWFGIYLTASLPTIEKKIKLRIKKRLKEGLVEEIKELLKRGYSWDDPGLNCLAYKEFRPFFEGKTSLKKVEKDWFKNERQYARRQLLWFRNDKRFLKVNVEKKNWLSAINKKVEKWYYER